MRRRDCLVDVQQVLPEFITRLQQKFFDALSVFDLTCSSISTFSASVLSDDDNAQPRASTPVDDVALAAEPPVFAPDAAPLPSALGKCVVVSASGTGETDSTTMVTEWWQEAGRSSRQVQAPPLSSAAATSPDTQVYSSVPSISFAALPVAPAYRARTNLPIFTQPHVNTFSKPAPTFGASVHLGALAHFGAHAPTFGDSAHLGTPAHPLETSAPRCTLSLRHTLALRRTLAHTSADPAC